MVRFLAPFVAAVCVVATAPANAAGTAPSTIVANPSAYEGKDVSVSGTVAKFESTTTPMGPVAAYQLCDTKCVVVIDKTNTAHKNGDIVTAAGTFKTTFHGPRRSFNNVVMVEK